METRKRRGTQWATFAGFEVYGNEIRTGDIAALVNLFHGAASVDIPINVRTTAQRLGNGRDVRGMWFAHFAPSHRAALALLGFDSPAAVRAAGGHAQRL